MPLNQIYVLVCAVELDYLSQHQTLKKTNSYNSLAVKQHVHDPRASRI